MSYPLWFTVKSMMKELSKAEEIARCQDTVTRLILAFRGLDKHDRSGRSKLERQLEEEKSKLLSLGRMVTTVTGAGFGFYDATGPDVLSNTVSQYCDTVRGYSARR